MCGICGVIAPGDPDRGRIERMTRALTHRGPDDVGTWYGDGVGFGHRRLSIIDLVAGHQPFLSEDGRHALVYNGEIYNFRELRAELESRGHVFHTRCDTEVVLAAYREYGERCLARFQGMFALAVWDVRERELFLARDIMGKKPLIYHHDGERFVFSSEIASLLECALVPRELNRDGLDYYLSMQNVPAPETMFRGVKKLLPAHWLRWKDGRVTTGPFWELDYTRKDRRRSPEDYIPDYWRLFKRAVEKRLISDVPLGVFLSGGIDSTSIVAAMRELEVHPIKSFTIAFEKSAELVDAGYAAEAAARFGTQHTVFTVKPEMYAIVDELVQHFGEPMADQANLPLYYLAREARKHVTVALSGEGGDEQFLGYSAYRHAKVAGLINRCCGPLGRILRPALGLGAGADAPGGVRKYLRFLRNALGPRDEIYAAMRTTYNESWKRRLLRDRAILANRAFRLFKETFARCPGDDFIDRILFTDNRIIIPDDLAPKLDIVSMIHSLEIRAPYLDKDLIEFAAAIPSDLKMPGLRHKFIPKKKLLDYFGPEFVFRRKAGFAPPTARWLRNELRAEMESLLLDTDDGLFDREYLRTAVREHVAGTHNHSGMLWTLIIFRKWVERFGVRL